MWPLLSHAVGSIVVSLDEVARAMKLVAERAASSPKAPPAARSRRRSAAAPGAGQSRRRRLRRQHRSLEVRRRSSAHVDQ
jgi:hypothetical protein